MEDRCKTCAHFGEMSEYDWCHECAMECNHYKPTGDLISRKAARIAVYGYEMQTGIAEMPLEFVHNKIDELPSVPAVPLDKLCEWLSVHAGRPIDCVGHVCSKCEFDGTGVGQEMCWKALITKWMNEKED